MGAPDAEAKTPLATSCEELTHWKRPWCWEGLGAGGEGDDRGWVGWMASLTRWTWIWVNSGSWWWTGRPGVLWFMGLQRVGHDWATQLTKLGASNWNWSQRFLAEGDISIHLPLWSEHPPTGTISPIVNLYSRLEQLRITYLLDCCASMSLKTHKCKMSPSWNHYLLRPKYFLQLPFPFHLCCLALISGPHHAMLRPVPWNLLFIQPARMN